MLGRRLTWPWTLTIANVEVAVTPDYVSHLIILSMSESTIFFINVCASVCGAVCGSVCWLVNDSSIFSGCNKTAANARITIGKKTKKHSPDGLQLETYLIAKVGEVEQG